MDTDILEKRLKRLERTNAALIIVLAVVCILFFFGSSDPGSVAGTIQCQRLEVVDTEGKVIAAVGVDADGSRGLFVNDPTERLRLAAIHDDTQTALYEFDSTGEIRIGIAQYAHGGGGVALHGPGGQGGAVLYLKEEGSLTFYSDSGTVLNRMTGRKD